MEQVDDDSDFKAMLSSISDPLTAGTTTGGGGGGGGGGSGPGTDRTYTSASSNHLNLNLSFNLFSSNPNNHMKQAQGQQPHHHQPHHPHGNATIFSNDYPVGANAKQNAKQNAKPNAKQNVNQHSFNLEDTNTASQPQYELNHFNDVRNVHPLSSSPSNLNSGADSNTSSPSFWGIRKFHGNLNSGNSTSNMNNQRYSDEAKAPNSNSDALFRNVGQVQQTQQTQQNNNRGESTDKVPASEISLTNPNTNTNTNTSTSTSTSTNSSSFGRATEASSTAMDVNVNENSTSNSTSNAIVNVNMETANAELPNDLTSGCVVHPPSDLIPQEQTQGQLNQHLQPRLHRLQQQQQQQQQQQRSSDSPVSFDSAKRQAMNTAAGETSISASSMYNLFHAYPHSQSLSRPQSRSISPTNGFTTPPDSNDHSHHQEDHKRIHHVHHGPGGHWDTDSLSPAHLLYSNDEMDFSGSENSPKGLFRKGSDSSASLVAIAPKNTLSGSANSEMAGRLRAMSDMHRHGVISEEEKAWMKSLILSNEDGFREEFERAERSGEWEPLREMLREGKFNIMTDAQFSEDMLEEFAGVNISDHEDPFGALSDDQEAPRKRNASTSTPVQRVRKIPTEGGGSRFNTSSTTQLSTRETMAKSKMAKAHSATSSSRNSRNHQGDEDGDDDEEEEEEEDDDNDEEEDDDGEDGGNHTGIDVDVDIGDDAHDAHDDEDEGYSDFNPSIPKTLRPSSSSSSSSSTSSSSFSFRTSAKNRTRLGSNKSSSSSSSSSNSANTQQRRPSRSQSKSKAITSAQSTPTTSSTSSQSQSEEAGGSGSGTRNVSPKKQQQQRRGGFKSSSSTQRNKRPTKSQATRRVSGLQDLDASREAAEDEHVSGNPALAKYRKNERERKRRLAVTIGFTELSELLNENDKPSKLDKAAILRSAVARIKELESRLENCTCQTFMDQYQDQYQSEDADAEGEGEGDEEGNDEGNDEGEGEGEEHGGYGEISEV